MLHVHTDRAAPGPGSLLRIMALPDRLMTADPGLVRLTMAARGTLSVLLTTLCAVLAAPLVHASPAAFAGGITLSLMAPFLMREPTLGQRQRTLLTLVAPAVLATLATALLHGHGPLGDSAFLLIVFGCYLLQSRGPRFVGIGLVTVVTTYVGLFLELPPATLGLQLLSILASVPIIAFACFVVLPMRLGATLRRTVSAVQGRAAQVLHTASQIQGPAAGQGAVLAQLRRDLAKLNEAALAADDQLAWLQPDGREAVRAGLIDLELATTRLIEALRREKPGRRHSIRLRLHERRMRRGQAYAMEPGMLEPGTLRAQLVELGRATHDLGVAARGMAPAREPPAPQPAPPGQLSWRMAIRVTLASALAMAAGMALSPNRWFWAVITVYVVFLNARSRGDTILRGIQRLAGTLLGIASGLGLAVVLGGHAALQIVALLLSVFGMFYFFTTSYTIGIFCVTVMLGLLYGMMGASLADLLVLRFEETVIGAVAAVLVAAFVMPLRTRDQVMRSGRGVLAALANAVRASRLALAGAPDAAPMVAMRRVDRQVADLRLALAPLTAGQMLWRSPLERPVPALLECVHWARVLAAASQGHRLAASEEALLAQSGQLEARLAGLAGVAVPAGASPEPALPSGATPADPQALKATLERLDQSVTRLADRLEVSAFAGFKLEA